MYAGLSRPTLSYGALLQGCRHGESGDGRHVEAERLLHRESDHQLPVPLLQGDHVRQGHTHATGRCGHSGCGLMFSYNVT